MIRHSMDVIKRAVEHLNPGQVPVLTVDQPLFGIAKIIQWNWPESYGEDKFVILLGGLHIEMATLATLGDLLDGSGWKMFSLRQVLQLQERLTPFSRAHMSNEPDMHTKSPSVHCQLCFVQHMVHIAWTQVNHYRLMIGV